MIHAIIKNERNTLSIEFPQSLPDVYEKMLSIGATRPWLTPLTSRENSPVQVKLSSDSELGNHLIRVLNGKNTVADANFLAMVVQEASPDIQEQLHRNILSDQYCSMKEVVDAVRQMTFDSGPVKRTYYCPLDGYLDDGDSEEPVPVENSFLRSYRWAIEDALAKDRDRDERDMAHYFNRDDGLKSKLASAVWGVEEYRRRLFGVIRCSLKEEPTEKEEDVLKDWICGQNSDGFGEHFEQLPIDTEEGDLYLSFWNYSKDYSIMTHDELDEYIDSQGLTMGGM